MKIRSLLLLGLCLVMLVTMMGMGLAAGPAWPTGAVARTVTSLFYPANKFAGARGTITLPSDTDFSGVTPWDPNGYGDTPFAFHGFSHGAGATFGVMAASGQFPVLTSPPVLPLQYSRIRGPKYWKPCVYIYPGNLGPGMRWQWFLLPYPSTWPENPVTHEKGIPGGYSVSIMTECRDSAPNWQSVRMTLQDPNGNQYGEVLNWQATTAGGENMYVRYSVLGGTTGTYLRNNEWGVNSDDPNADGIGIQNVQLERWDQSSYNYIWFDWTPAWTYSQGAGAGVTVTPIYQWYRELISITRL
jgi:hypothetical protein